MPDTHALAQYDAMPTMVGMRKARITTIGAPGARPLRPLGYRKGRGHTPRTKA